MLVTIAGRKVTMQRIAPTRKKGVNQKAVPCSATNKANRVIKSPFAGNWRETPIRNHAFDWSPKTTKENSVVQIMRANCG